VNESAFTFQTLPKLRVGKGGQEPDHCKRNCTFADKVDLPLENILRVVIESYNKTGHDLDTIALNFSHRFKQVAFCILRFVGFFQTCGRGRLNTEKYTMKTGGLHHFE